jgi:DNA polymerase III subunit delta'
MQFQEVVGHANTKMQLVNMVNTNRIPHAVMLSGKEGAGTLPLAIALAQYIMCNNKQQNESCNECSSCKKNQMLQHPDVHYCFPVVKLEVNKIPICDDFIKTFRKAVQAEPYLNNNDWLLQMNAENKQSNITAKECREIIKKLQLRAYEGGFKILIMWLPEFLGNEGNILLKLIEEPPKNTIFIFATEQYAKIIGTIQSRVQLVQLNALADVEIKNHLTQLGNNEETALQAASMAMGNYREAKILLQNAESSFFPIVRDWFNYLFTNNGPALMQWVLEVSAQGREQNKLLLQYIINRLENLVRLKNASDLKLLLHPSELDLLRKLIAKNVTEIMAELVSDILGNAITHIERNLNTKITLHAISLQAKDVFSGKSLYL